MQVEQRLASPETRAMHLFSLIGQEWLAPLGVSATVREAIGG